MNVPQKHRDALQTQCEGQLTLTKHPDGCLMLFPRQAWEAFREKIAALPMGASTWKRIFMGSAVDVELDSAGRILIAPELREYASLGKDVMLIGMGSHFEIWDSALLRAKEQAAMAQGIPDTLNDFSF